MDRAARTTLLRRRGKFRLSPYESGLLRAVFTNAFRHKLKLYSTGLVKSALCAHCGQEDENEEHMSHVTRGIGARCGSPSRWDPAG